MHSEEEIAFHEAGHAVAAVMMGMGIVRANLGKRYVRTAEQNRLEEKGVTTANPERPLADEVVEFYQRDIRVRLAGPLAQARYAGVVAARPDRISLSLYGGAVDRQVVDREVELLQSARPFDARAYINWCKQEVWSALGQWWGGIETVAAALEAERDLSGARVVELLAGVGMSPPASPWLPGPRE